MPNLISDIGDGISKVAQDLTEAAQPLVELSLQIAFEFLLHTATSVLLS